MVKSETCLYTPPEHVKGVLFLRFCMKTWEQLSDTCKNKKKIHTHISSISSIISSISIWSQSIYWLGFYLQALRSLSSQTTNAFQCGPKSWPRPRFLGLGPTLKFWNISVLNTVVAMTSLEQHGDSRSYLAVQQVEWHPPFSNSSAASFNKEFAPSSRRKERKYCLFLPMEFLPI